MRGGYYTTLSCKFFYQFLKKMYLVISHLSSVAQLCPTLCDPIHYSLPGFPAHHQHTELAQTHVHRVSDAIHLIIYRPLSPPAFNLSQHQGSHQVAKVLDFQLQHQSFQRIFRTDFLQDGLVGSSCSPRDSQESSPIPQFKSINSSALSFHYSLTLTCKNHSLERWTFVDKAMSLLFNMLSKLVITFFQGASVF